MGTTAACEAGIGSILDRNMPYAEIKNSQDMLDFLTFLKKAEKTRSVTASTRPSTRTRSVLAERAFRNPVVVSQRAFGGVGPELSRFGRGPKRGYRPNSW